MGGNAAATLGAVAVSLGIAMSVGTGTAAADSAESKSEATSASSSHDAEPASEADDSGPETNRRRTPSREEQGQELDADPAEADADSTTDDGGAPSGGSAEEDSADLADNGQEHHAGDDDTSLAEEGTGQFSERFLGSREHHRRDLSDGVPSENGTERDTETGYHTVEPVEQTAPVMPDPVTSAVQKPAAVGLSALGVTAASPGTAPAAPTGILSWIVGAAAWVQREVDYFVNGGVVTATPSQSLISRSDGAVLGDLNVSADDRDRLSFRLLGQPNSGSVVLGNNGKFAYLPSVYPTEGVADSFTVAISNQGLNLRSLMGLINPALNTTVVKVGVEVPALDPGDASNNTTAGFTIVNMTGYDLTFTSGSGDFDGPIPGRTVIRTGERQHFEVIVDWKDDDQGILHYTSSRPGAPETVLTLNVSSWFSGSTSTIECGTSTCDVYYDGSTLTATILAPPHTAIEVPADRAAEQTAILEEFCGDGALGTCSFTATSQEKDYAVQHDVDTFRNEFDTTATLTEQITTVYAQKTSYSVSAKVGLKIFDLVSAEVSAKYGNEWTETYTFSDTFKVQLAGWRAGSIASENPIIRYTGDFTVVVGNTTWYLRGTTIEQADTSGTRPTRFTYSEWAIEPKIDNSVLA
jgi:hypothetical protein